ncbi:tight adherence protein C [Granulicella rosea]|uniref:Tight adherence protein C n=1 Tax=Granulicella rosea TaxID=474952 RepID=A0A239ERM8_9BACT|nr:type II secretion system F family protein [Granulicella rosea]SNS47295.1 tight adherence protein C [Granulicella rosea]
MIFYLAIAVTTFSAIALLMAPMLLRPSPEAQRILDVVSSSRPDRRTVTEKEQVQERVLSMARDFRSRLGLAENPKLKARLYAAGMREAKAADVFFAAQFLTPLVLAFAASFAPDNTMFFVFAAAAVGYIAPDFWLTSKTKKRNNRIRRSMPDAIDLLVICVDAGLGLDQALLRVGEELAISHPDINEEFTQVHLEQRAGKPRMEAWQSLAERTKIEEFTSFVSMLIQSERFGTPIIKALTRFADELRTKRRQHAEEAAAKTKIKIIFPLVICIFPCIFIVLLAPAILSIAAGVKGLSN